MSHGVSAFATSLFVFLWFAWRRSLEPRHWIILGIVGGVMALVRIQDGVLLALPLADIGLGWLRRVGLLLIGPVLAGVLQMAVWMRLWGIGFVTLVSRQNLMARDPHVMDVLLSPRHGLFTWTPLWAVAVLGLLLWLRRDRRISMLTLLAVSLAVILNSSMVDWWGSDGFGQRRLLGLTALFAMGIAEVVDRLRARPLLPIALILAGFSVWNHEFEVIYNRKAAGPRNEAISLDRLAATQVQLLWQHLFSWRDRLPNRFFVVAYDNLKGSWIDEGRPVRAGASLAQETPELPILLGSGWRPPEVQDGVSFRSTWGKRSRLTVLLKTPGDFRVFVRGRSEIPGEVVGVTLEVNGTPAGEASATASWANLEFHVPAAALQPGLNELLLISDKTARGRDPEHHAKNTAFSVQTIRFARVSATGAPAASSPEEAPATDGEGTADSDSSGEATPVSPSR